jgi:hypothetical protein
LRPKQNHGATKRAPGRVLCLQKERGNSRVNSTCFQTFFAHEWQ